MPDSVSEIFVRVRFGNWVSAAHIVWIEPSFDDAPACTIHLADGALLAADETAEDLLGRIHNALNPCRG